MNNRDDFAHINDNILNIRSRILIITYIVGLFMFYTHPYMETRVKGFGVMNLTHRSEYKDNSTAEFFDYSYNLETIVKKCSDDNGFVVTLKKETIILKDSVQDKLEVKNGIDVAEIAIHKLMCSNSDNHFRIKNNISKEQLKNGNLKLTSTKQYHTSKSDTITLTNSNFKKKHGLSWLVQENTNVLIVNGKNAKIGDEVFYNDKDYVNCAVGVCVLKE